MDALTSVLVFSFFSEIHKNGTNRTPFISVILEKKGQTVHRSKFTGKDNSQFTNKDTRTKTKAKKTVKSQTKIQRYKDKESAI